TPAPTSRLTRTLLGGPAARPSSRRLAWFVRRHKGASCEVSRPLRSLVHLVHSLVAGRVARASPIAAGLAHRAAVSLGGHLCRRCVRVAQEHSVLAGAASWLSGVAVRAECSLVPPNLSLNPDASPAALARRPLGAG